MSFLNLPDHYLTFSSLIRTGLSPPCNFGRLRILLHTKNESKIILYEIRAENVRHFKFLYFGFISVVSDLKKKPEYGM